MLSNMRMLTLLFDDCVNAGNEKCGIVMAVRKFYVRHQKDGYPYDRQRKSYFSWGFDIRIRGERITERGFLTQKDALDAALQLKKAYRVGGYQRMPYLADLFQKKLNTLHPSGERTLTLRVFKKFLSIIPPLLTVSELKKTHLTAFKDVRTQEGASVATVRREFVPIMAALNNVDEFFDIEGYRPPKKPVLTIPKTRKEAIIGLEDRKRLLNYLLSSSKSNRNIGIFLQMCLLTVSRPGEIARLTAADIDLDQKTITIRGTKTERKRHSVRRIPISPTAEALIREKLLVTRKNDYLFTSKGKITTPMRKALKAACEHLGIKYGRKDPHGITFYTARHTATTVLAHSNRVDVKTAGSFSGHSDAAMTLYYTHTNLKTIEIASNVLEENMGNKLLDG